MWDKYRRIKGEDTKMEWMNENGTKRIEEDIKNRTMQLRKSEWLDSRMNGKMKILNKCPRNKRTNESCRKEEKTEWYKK